MAGEVHELSEVLVRRVFLNNKDWREYILNIARDDMPTDGMAYHISGPPIIPPDSVIAELAEAIKIYADTHSKETVRQIVRLTFNLEGYKECGLAMWKLLYQINSIRVQMLRSDLPEQLGNAKALGEILTMLGIKLEDGETDAKS